MCPLKIRIKYFSGNCHYHVKFGYFSGKYRVKFGHANFVNFTGKYHVKSGNFVNFSYIYFRAKCRPPPNVAELLRLCLRDLVDADGSAPSAHVDIAAVKADTTRAGNGWIVGILLTD